MEVLRDRNYWTKYGNSRSAENGGVRLGALDIATDGGNAKRKAGKLRNRKTARTSQPSGDEEKDKRWKGKIRRRAN